MRRPESGRKWWEDSDTGPEGPMTYPSHRPALTKYTPLTETRHDSRQSVGVFSVLVTTRKLLLGFPGWGAARKALEVECRRTQRRRLSRCFVRLTRR